MSKTENQYFQVTLLLTILGSLFLSEIIIFDCNCSFPTIMDKSIALEGGAPIVFLLYFHFAYKVFF